KEKQRNNFFVKLIDHHMRDWPHMNHNLPSYFYSNLINQSKNKETYRFSISNALCLLCFSLIALEMIEPLHPWIRRMLIKVAKQARTAVIQSVEISFKVANIKGLCVLKITWAVSLSKKERLDLLYFTGGMLKTFGNKNMQEWIWKTWIWRLALVMHWLIQMKIFGEEGSGSGLDFGGWKGGGFLNERGEQNLSFIAISETVKRSNFIWHTKEPSGHSGGILMGIDMDIYDIGAIDEGDFYTIFKNTWASAYDNAGGSVEEQDGLSILQYADDTLNNSDWKIWMEREAYLSYRGSRENRLLSLINEDGIATVATVLATVPLNYITCSVDLTNSGQFTVQSMYMSIINNGNVAVSVAFNLIITC
ncbi:hypothetical protein ACJX0J_017892, partial [Zea mays]